MSTIHDKAVLFATAADLRSSCNLSRKFLLLAIAFKRSNAIGSNTMLSIDHTRDVAKMYLQLFHLYPNQPQLAAMFSLVTYGLSWYISVAMESAVSRESSHPPSSQILLAVLAHTAHVLKHWRPV